MIKYILTCESTVDIYKEDLELLNVPYIDYNYFLDDEKLTTNISKDFSYDYFYHSIEMGKKATTTQVTKESYLNFFTPFLKEGYDVLHITFSSGLSGSFGQATLASEELNKKFTENKVIVIDSLAGATGYGLLMRELVERRDKGYLKKELITWLENNKLTLNHWFYTTDISYFIKGGRVKWIEGIIGKRLSICPLMNVSVNGEIIPRFKIIGKKRVFKKALDQMEKLAFGGLHYTGKCYITHSNDLTEALKLKKAVEEKFLFLEEIKIYPAGAITASHAGPGAVGIFFFGEKRND